MGFTLLSWTVVVLVLCAAGVLITGLYAWKRASLGMGLFTLLFAWHAATALMAYSFKAAYIESFQREQIGPSQWTAPVIELDTGILVTLSMVLLGCWLVGRRLPIPRSENGGETAA